MAIETDSSFLGTQPTHPFHEQKYGMRRANLRPIDLPRANISISIYDHKRLCFNALSALVFLRYTLLN